MKGWLKYKVLGQTLDDAAGEAFDKVAKMLGLGYPGGPIVSEMAGKFKRSPGSLGQIKFPRPMINSKDYNFSFSGLKTSVLYKIRDLGELNQKIKKEICREFQQAAIDVLVKKTIRAGAEYRAKTIILGGGVAANRELRRQMAKAVSGLKNEPIFLSPEIKFSGDNAAMIAVAAYFRASKNKKIGDGQNIVADSNLQL